MTLPYATQEKKKKEAYFKVSVHLLKFLILRILQRGWGTISDCRNEAKE